MTRTLLTLAAAAGALTLALTGCAPSTAAPADDSNTAEAGSNTSDDTADLTPAEQIDALISAGKLPASFDRDAEGLRVSVSGDEFGVRWIGAPLTDGCEASSGIPNLTMSAMLLQDVAISDVQQCGDVWQATQADGSRVAWNEAR